MKLEITYTPEDISQAQKLWLASSKIRYLHLFYGILLGIAIISAIIYPSTLTLVAIFIIFLVFCSGTILQKYRSKAMLKEQPDLQGTLILELDENGTKWKTATGSNAQAWNTYIRFSASENMLLLYRSPLLFEMIPRRVLSADDWDKLNKLVQSKIGSSKHA